MTDGVVPSSSLLSGDIAPQGSARVAPLKEPDVIRKAAPRKRIFPNGPWHLASATAAKVSKHDGPRNTPWGVLARLALAVSVTGCAVGPDYMAPSTHLAPFHNLAALSAQRTATPAPALDRWWTGFNDPTLVTVVQRALAQNLDLAAALARVQQANAVAAAAGAELLPTVDLDAAAAAQRQSLVSPLGALGHHLPGYSRDQREYNVGAAASWEIDLAGGLRRSAAAASDEVQAAQAEQAGTRITIAADAADAYLQIRGLQARLAVAQDQIETDASLLRLVQVRRNMGQAEDREVAQADALLKQARSTIPPLRIALEAQLNRTRCANGRAAGNLCE